MTTVPELLGDLDAEYRQLRTSVSTLTPDGPAWDLATPAQGWAVRDQISHLAFFDDAARMAVTEPDVFIKMAEGMMAALVDGAGDPMDVHLLPGRSMDGVGLLAWWDAAHRGMMEAFTGADPSIRVPWFGPPMGLLSFVSARLMETWAHGQDVVDALGLARPPTDRLRHVAHLGVRARPFSYLVRDRQVPTGRVDVLLSAPSGEEWSWEVGTDDGTPPGSIAGTALDFCLVVTQRRHCDDTALVVVGGAAVEWMSIAQAFAGPPGPGRPPLPD